MDAVKRYGADAVKARMLQALKAARVSLAEEEDYYRHKDLLRTIDAAIAEAESEARDPAAYRGLEAAVKYVHEYWSKHGLWPSVPEVMRMAVCSQSEAMDALSKERASPWNSQSWPTKGERRRGAKPRLTR